jgi:hypothetical protein
MLMVGARGIAPRLATDADVTDGETPEPGGKPIPLALSQLALRLGYALLISGTKSELYRCDLERLYKLQKASQFAIFLLKILDPEPQSRHYVLPRRALSIP